MARAQASLTTRDATGAGPDSVARICNAGGRSPVLLICEHASNHLPESYGDLGLGAAERESHIAWDPGALGVSHHLSRILDAPLVSATVSRLVLDLNRDPGAPDSITVLSERTVVPGNANLAPAERDRRVAEIYDSFHGAIDRFLAARAAPTLAVISVHSFTPVYRDIDRPWQIGLIFDADERLARQVEAGLRRDPGLSVGMNQPYSPADRVFHTLERHAARRGLARLMIEIRNDLIRQPDQQASWASRLAPLIEEALGGV